MPYTIWLLVTCRFLSELLFNTYLNLLTLEEHSTKVYLYLDSFHCLMVHVVLCVEFTMETCYKMVGLRTITRLLLTQRRLWQDI